MIVILVGASGSGKGKICDYLKLRYPDKFGIIAVGDLIRNEIKKNSEIGQQIKQHLTAISLVDNRIVWKLIKPLIDQELAKNRIVIFDGFPRNFEQALMLDQNYRVFLCCFLKASYGVIKKRLEGRRVCMQCGNVTTVVQDTKAKYGICRKCGGVLAVRNDDNEESIKKKFGIYKQQYKETYAYFKGRHFKVHANESEGRILKEFLKKFQKFYDTHKDEYSVNINLESLIPEIEGRV